MDLLVLLIIIAGVSNIVRQNKKSKEDGQENRNRKPQWEELQKKWQSAEQQWMSRNTAGQSSQTSEQQRQMEMQRKRQREEEQQRRDEERQEKQRQLEKRQAELRKAQQELSRQKNAKQQKTHQGQTTADTYTKEDILSRSAKDVNEDFGEDTLKKEAGRHEACVEGHYEQKGDLLKTVEDLMILGPNCTISYERDFVGEGEKMVESFKLERRTNN